MSAFLDAVNMASVAIILAVIIEIGKVTLLDWKSVVIAMLGFGTAFYFRNLNTAFIILGGSIIGYLLTFI